MAMQISNIVFAYFVIGAVMLGGGVVAQDEAGVVKAVITNDGGNVQPNEDLSANVTKQDSVIGGVVSAFGGGLLIVWNLAKLLFKFIHWPIFAFTENNAPPSITILLGGGMTLSLYLAILGMVMRSS